MPGRYQGLLLYVEDDDSQRDAMTAYLSERIAAEVVSVPSSERALSLLESRYPDAILSDIAMPAMNGIELLKKVREDLALETPFVFLTGHMSKTYLQNALALGATNFFEKSGNMSELIHVLTAAMNLGKSIKKMTLEFEAQAEKEAGFDPKLLRESYQALVESKREIWRSSQLSSSLLKFKKTS